MLPVRSTSRSQLEQTRRMQLHTLISDPDMVKTDTSVILVVGPNEDHIVADLVGGSKPERVLFPALSAQGRFWLHAATFQSRALRECTHIGYEVHSNLVIATNRQRILVFGPHRMIRWALDS